VEEAEDVASRWMDIIERIYLQEGKLFEKYDVIEMKSGGGGEYPGQEGFGWTNAVYLKFYEMFKQKPLENDKIL